MAQPDVVRVSSVKSLGVYLDHTSLCAFMNMSNKLQETVTSDFICCNNCVVKNDLATIVERYCFIQLFLVRTVSLGWWVD